MRPLRVWIFLLMLLSACATCQHVLTISCWHLSGCATCLHVPPVFVSFLSACATRLRVPPVCVCHFSACAIFLRVPPICVCHRVCVCHLSACATCMRVPFFYVFHQSACATVSACAICLHVPHVWVCLPMPSVCAWDLCARFTCLPVPTVCMWRLSACTICLRVPSVVTCASRDQATCRRKQPATFVWYLRLPVSQCTEYHYPDTRPTCVQEYIFSCYLSHFPGTCLIVSLVWHLHNCVTCMTLA